MTNRTKTSLLSLILALSSAGVSWGATTTANLTVNSTLASRAQLVLGSGTINFADADPTTVPSISATENPVSVTARIRTGNAGNATLTVLAGGDLVAGPSTIAISNVTWAVTGAGFVAGAMSKTVPQSAGSWTGPGQMAGTFNYALANSWSYATGSYSATITYTLTAP